MTLSHASYQFSEWTSHREGTLKKLKVTIQDVDGECSMKVSGRNSKCYPIAAHYQLPLRALNKKFGLYKKIVTHLNGSSNLHATNLRNTFMSLLGYIKDIFNGFISDARTSANPLGSEFRSPALDYYLWLDHKVDGFDDGSRGRLKIEWNVTFEGLKKGECKDILEYHTSFFTRLICQALMLKEVDWGAYHKAKCNDHDFCGAIQGCGEGDNIQSLLISVDAFMDGLNTPDNTADGTCVEAADIGHPGNQASVIATCLYLPGALPEVTTPGDLIDNARGLKLANVCDGRMEEYDQDVQETQSTEHAVLFHGARLYSNCEVQAVYSFQEETIQTEIEYNEHATQFHGYGSCSHQEVHAVPHMQDQITQTETETAHAGNLEGNYSGSSDVLYTAMSPFTDEHTGHEYPVDHHDWVPASIDDCCWGDMSNDFSGSMEPVSPTACESFMVVAGDSAQHGVDIPTGKSKLSARNVDLPTRTEDYDPSVPMVKSGSRGRKKDSISTIKPQRKGRTKSPSVPGRPVVFAKQPLMPRTKAGVTSPHVRKYTIDDLMSEAQKDSKNIKPHVRAFLLDPKRDNFIRKHMQSHHNELLDVASFIASLMCSERLPDNVIPGASSLMSIEFWLADIAHKCKQAADSDNFTLPPLAHCVLLELSTLTRKDENSVRNTLQTSIWDKNQGSIVKPVILYLCKLRGSKPGADDDYASGFKLLAYMMQDNQVRAIQSMAGAMQKICSSKQAKWRLVVLDVEAGYLLVNVHDIGAPVKARAPYDMPHSEPTAHGPHKERQQAGR
ncbi:hypothetical protein DFJ58DRAFT_848341 [Suillus subalutaceus]|uniref:uncharacterized protein n=1 Tax=Suillus subalutaceus TaxID=48586 RepID=UPI001B86251A|nr:uncharacterized protein DFJ58DRAFT_848341 [Suillus subalutaceus]KAG1830948.1 hypothetical protein DFJ58DRAFT_848341 [Suillus subalutaceus]